MTTAPPTKTLRLMISGLVQGVNFRRWLKGQADARGIYGWTRNRADGSVEAVLCGEAQKIDDLIHTCQTGPTLARVDKLQVEPADYAGPPHFVIETTV